MSWLDDMKIADATLTEGPDRLSIVIRLECRGGRVDLSMGNLPAGEIERRAMDRIVDRINGVGEAPVAKLDLRRRPDNGLLARAVLLGMILGAGLRSWLDAVTR
ncbi:MAG: hypothetical protein NBV67_00750 [Tagaea sp.]|nr:hypothetical protein [Tagaea sp.]